MSGADLSGIERGSLGSRGSLPSCSTSTRVHGGAIGSSGTAGATWPLPALSAPISQLWFGRQVHSTRLFVWSQLILATVAVLLIVTVLTGTVRRSQFNWILGPVIQWAHIIDEGAYSTSESALNDSLRLTTVNPQLETTAEHHKTRESDGNAQKEMEETRNLAAVALGIAYFYLLSIPLAWWGVQAADARGRREEKKDGECRATARTTDKRWYDGPFSGCGSVSCLRRATSILLLAPWIISVVSLLVPLLLFTIYLISEPCYYVYETRPESQTGITFVLYLVWFRLIPLIVLWVMMFYFLAGCTFALVVTWRRADGRFGGVGYGTFGGFGRGTRQRNVPLRESAAAASFSWTFRSTKDRYRITNKDGDLNKSTYSMASNRSYKSTRNPTLRGYTRKTDDMDVSLLSEDNYGGGDSLERNYNNNCVPNRRMSQSEQMRASRGFTAYSGPGVSRAPLEPVEEEEYTPTPDKTAENGDLRM